jgi:hypothetical protein
MPPQTLTDLPRAHHARSESDPLQVALRAQQANESQDERQLRLHKEAEARKLSDAIDEQLKAEEKVRAKKRREVKILLLGGFMIFGYEPPTCILTRRVLATYPYTP